MATDGQEVFYLKEEVVEIASEDGHSYGEVPEEDGVLSSDGDEDLETAMQLVEIYSSKQLREKSHAGESGDKDSHDKPSKTASVTHGEEVIEDFVRNFLAKMGLKLTVHYFQSEWYQLMAAGKLNDYHSESVPDVYSQNRLLQQHLDDCQAQLDCFKEVARVAKEKYVRLKKERDYHRMHHRRTVQEKERLMTDIKRMKDHYAEYEPTLQRLKTRYQACMREKQLACQERDRATSEVAYLQATLHTLRPSSQPLPPILDKANQIDISAGHALSTRHTVSSSSDKAAVGGPLPMHSNNKTNQKRKVHSLAHLPAEPANPYLQISSLPVCAHLTRVGGLRLDKCIQAHDYAASCIALHPSKNVLATGSDDHTWKLWAVAEDELLMTGRGHTDWLSYLAFHPQGEVLASSSGDGSVRLWRIGEASCKLVLTNHCQPVWGCDWHWTGQFLASGAMDHCCKLWNAEGGECVVTLRGHADSVNKVKFLPYCNSLASCSADKTVSLWDIRTGLCTHTYYAHQNSINAVLPTMQATELFSADSFGTVIHWDLRSTKQIGEWDCGPYAINDVAIDPAGTVLACASGSCLIYLLEKASHKVTALEGHRGSAEALCFGHNAQSLYSGGADGLITFWQ